MNTFSNDVICSKTYTDLRISLAHNTFQFCCKAKAEKLQLISWNDIIYSPGITKRREDSINGIRNNQCDFCWKTDSQYKNIFNTYLDIPENPFESIDYLEIYCDNICNLSCLYCNADFSSMIAKEKNYNAPFMTNRHNIEDIGNFLIEIINNKEIKLAFAGGEPTLSKTYHQLIQYLIKHVPEKKVYLCTTTNGIINNACKKKILSYMEKTSWKWVWGFSGEAKGNVFNQIRFHGNYKIWLENLVDFSLNKNTDIINFNPAINIFSIKTLPDFFSDVLSIVQDRKYAISGNTVILPPEFSIYYLPISFNTYIKNAKEIFLHKSKNCVNIDSVLRWFTELSKMLGQKKYNYDLLNHSLENLNNQKENKLNVDLLLNQTIL